MVSLHVPVVTLRRCLALDQYYLCRTHPAHRTLTRIEVNLVNCRSIYHFLAIADANRKKRLGKDGKRQRRDMGWNKPAVHIYGGSSYGANLTPQEAQDWLAGLLEKLEIGTAITAAHFGDKHGRFDFHLLVPFYDPAGRPLKPARKSLRGHVRACACAMTDALNTKRLEAGNHLTIGNLDSAGALFFMEKEPEKTIGEPGPAKEPTQPAPVDEPPVAAAVASQVKNEPSPHAEGKPLDGNLPAESSASRSDSKRAGAGEPEAARQTVPVAASPGMGPAAVRSAPSKTAPKAEVGPELEKTVPSVSPSGNPPARQGLGGILPRGPGHAQPVGSKQEVAKPLPQGIHRAPVHGTATTTADREQIDADKESRRKERERTELWARLSCIMIWLWQRDAEYDLDFADRKREAINHSAKLLVIHQRPVRPETGGDLADYLHQLMKLNGDYTGDAAKKVGELEEIKRGMLWRDLALLLISHYLQPSLDTERAKRIAKLCERLLDAYGASVPKVGQPDWLLLVTHMGENVTGMAKDRIEKTEKRAREARPLWVELTVVLGRLDNTPEPEDKVQPRARACELCAELLRLHGRDLPPENIRNLDSLLLRTMELADDCPGKESGDFVAYERDRRLLEIKTKGLSQGS